MRLNAYYFGFTATGDETIDRILSAVACAGKAYHHTENWTEPLEPYDDMFRGQTCVEWIQHAANDAASVLASARRVVEAARPITAKYVVRDEQLSVMVDGEHWTDEQMRALIDALAAHDAEVRR